MITQSHNPTINQISRNQSGCCDSINFYGAFTLLKKEVWRFAKVYHQTIFSPVINIVLFLAVFSLSLGNHTPQVNGVDFAVFVSAGLIMMAAMQNAFANSSSSFVMGKVMGNIIDILMPPLGAREILFAFSFGAVLRGIAVAIAAFLVILIFVPMTFFSVGLAIFYLVFSCLFLGLLGVLCGVLSDSFDHMSAMTSYFITPMTFLSGTFYSTKSLPEFWQKIAHLNPFFYMIDGFRYSMTSYHDGDIATGICYILAINFMLTVILYRLINKGYRIKN